MHLIRRSVCRAVSSPSALQISKPRSITTTSPFLLRSKRQSSILQISKRFSSNGVGSETQEPAADTSATSSKSNETSSADESETSSIRSAISSATESASTYASEAAESALDSASQVKESGYDAAQAAGAAAGFSAPRGRSPARGGNQDYAPRTARRTTVAGLKPTNTLYAGNLLFEITDADLRREFSPFGNITNITMATDARGMSKGFAYIEFESVDSATEAAKALNETVLEGRRMIVNYKSETKRPSRAGTSPPSKTLFIGNLAYEMSDADLNKLFMSIKNVIDVRVAIDRRTGQPRGFAHADFTDEESAATGLEYLQGREVYGRPMRVDFSATTTPGARSERTGGYRGDSGDRNDRNGSGGY